MCEGGTSGERDERGSVGAWDFVWACMGHEGLGMGVSRSHVCASAGKRERGSVFGCTCKSSGLPCMGFLAFPGG